MRKNRIFWRFFGFLGFLGKSIDFMAEVCYNGSIFGIFPPNPSCFVQTRDYFLFLKINIGRANVLLLPLISTLF